MISRSMSFLENDMNYTSDEVKDNHIKFLVTSELKDQFFKQCRETGTPVSFVLRKLVVDYLKEKGVKNLDREEGNS